MVAWARAIVPLPIAVLTEVRAGAGGNAVACTVAALAGAAAGVAGVVLAVEAVT
jgi:hypothetical protein